MHEPVPMASNFQVLIPSMTYENSHCFSFILFYFIFSHIYFFKKDELIYGPSVGDSGTP
jgi:hypothetical protein